MKAKNTQKKILIESKAKPIKKIDPKQLQEQEGLFSQADSISPINKKIDKAEIIQLTSGEFVNVDEYVDEHFYAEVATHFYKIFYNLIADLLGISREEMKPFRKPYVVALLKNKLIYGRFPNAIQKKIYARNPYIGYCTRKYWNYQTLTKTGDLSLRDFINDFQILGESVLGNNGNLKIFIIEYCKKYQLPIQLELFDL